MARIARHALHIALLVGVVCASSGARALQPPPDEREGTNSPYFESLALSAGPTLVEYPPGAPLDGAPQATLTRFFDAYSSLWEVRWDRRSNRPHLIEGAGFPLIPGRGNALSAASTGLPLGCELALSDLEPLLRGFLARFPELMRVSQSELVLDPDGSTAFGSDRQTWFVEFRQVRGGVPVEGAKVFFRINSGNVVQLGADLVADVEIDPVPRLARSAAFDAALRAAGAAQEAVAELLDAGTLAILPALRVGEKPGEAYAGEPGEGYAHQLVWKFRFRLRGDDRTYEVVVDAGDGRVLRFRDANAYAQVSGGIFPSTNSDPEVVRPFAYATVTNGGTKVTDASGAYTYTGGPATSTLNGRYTRIADACGGVSLTDSSTGELAFGTSAGTDCATPGFGGSGNTHAARTSFYHLTAINRKAAGYYPANAWLDAGVQASTNINASCNAIWNGSAILFYRTGGGCTNAGEIAAVMFHEWGHGFDDNTGGPPVGDGAAREALGDTFAFLETRDGCIGQNLIPGFPCHNCVDCTGVRDVSDFDLSGPGAIARPSTIRDNAGIDCDTFSCPFTSFRGPMGFEGHCESLIASAANWDLAQMLVAAHGTEVGWDQMSRIWYGSLVPAKSAYQVVSGGTCNTAAVVDGCAATNWYTVYLAVDDDNGNLADGTPNACRIWDAFDAHGIACGARPPCSVEAACATSACPLASCSPPLPPASACPIDSLRFADKTSLAWSGPPGCALPLVYDTARGNLDCLRGACRPVHDTGPLCLPLANDAAGNSATDATPPGTGEGYWYLVRVNQGTWNSNGARQCTDYDATLPLGCP